MSGFDVTASHNRQRDSIISATMN